MEICTIQTVVGGREIQHVERHQDGKNAREANKKNMRKIDDCAKDGDSIRLFWESIRHIIYNRERLGVHVCTRTTVNRANRGK